MIICSPVLAQAANFIANRNVNNATTIEVEVEIPLFTHGTANSHRCSMSNLGLIFIYGYFCKIFCELHVFSSIVDEIKMVGGQYESACDLRRTDAGETHATLQYNSIFSSTGRK